VSGSIIINGPCTFVCIEVRRAAESQRVVSTEEAEQLTDEGWIFIGVLPNGKVTAGSSKCSNPVKADPEGLEPSLNLPAKTNVNLTLPTLLFYLYR
jgi:hypothetical protein